MNFLHSNLKHLRKLKKLSQEEFATQLNTMLPELQVKRSSIASYEEKRANPPIELLKLMSRFFEQSMDDLVDKDFSGLTEIPKVKIGENRVLFPITVSEDNDDYIEVVPEKARAGYLAGYSDPEYIGDLDRMKFPFLPQGKYRAFPITGDSMLPIGDGCYVVGKFTESVNDLKNGKTYILLTTNEGIVYKRVFNKIKKEGKIHLHSDNPAFKPYTVDPENILEIWEYSLHVNTNEPAPEPEEPKTVMEIIREMQAELVDLKAKINK